MVAVDGGVLAVLVGSTIAVEVAVNAVVERSAGVVGGALPIEVGTNGP